MRRDGVQSGWLGQVYQACMHLCVCTNKPRNACSCTYVLHCVHSASMVNRVHGVQIHECMLTAYTYRGACVTTAYMHTDWCAHIITGVHMQTYLLKRVRTGAFTFKLVCIYVDWYVHFCMRPHTCALVQICLYEDTLVFQKVVYFCAGNGVADSAWSISVFHCAMRAFRIAGSIGRSDRL